MTPTLSQPAAVAQPSDVPTQPGAKARRISSSEALTVVLGAALAVAVGVDGPAPWPAVRALVILGLTAATLWARRRLGTRGGGTVLLAFGLVGVIAGVGIGVPYAIAVGTSAVTVAGLAALVTGVALVGIAATTLVRQARSWRKLLALPIGLGIALLIVAPISMAVFVTNVPPEELGSGTPTDGGMAYEDVSLRTDDGVRLTGWYVPSRNGAAIVLLGGLGTRADEIDHAAVLARHGYGVLLLDVRGHGGSDGDAMLWGWNGDVDVRAAIDYLDARPDVDDTRIGALGMSVGGEQVIGAAGADDRIRAVVAEGASARGARDEGDPARGVEGWIMRYVDWTTKHAADLMTSAEPPTKLRDAIAAAAPRPVMVIAAGTQPQEIDAAHVFQSAAPGSVELWIAPDAGHTEAYDMYPAEWEQRVIDFLDRALD